jgi:glutamyl-tRNA synthetase
VGNLRIALLNYLFVRKNGGKFILRIDDTDLERSSKESEDLILKDLEWLGIGWDELHRQSERLEKYRLTFNELVNVGRVYPCYETKEELLLRRKIRASQGIPPIYERAALKLTAEEKEKLERSGRKPYWRFKLSADESVRWWDLVHGEISIPLDAVSDPVLVKPDGSFVYTFASVVDDVELAVSHVIRGDDHITNTAVQIDIFLAIAGKSPDFAHVPLLASIDGQEVSKRVGSALSVSKMRENGVDPGAILSILASLGTSNNADHRDKMHNLIEKFSFEKMSLASPKFNPEDVKTFTRKILAEKTFAEVEDELRKLNLKNISEEFWNTIRENLHFIGESVFWHEILFNEINVLKEDENFVNLMLSTLTNPVDFDKWIANLKLASGRRGKELFHPLRMVLTGHENGPELRKIIDFLGYERLRRRIVRHLEAK